jgi:hypothetical protein
MFEQSIPLPKSSSHTEYEQLAYLESFDAVVDKLYAMLVYKETKVDSGKWVIRIKPSVTAGTVFDPDNVSLQNGLRKAAAHKEEYLVWGFNLTPKDDDPRLVENRILFDDKGSPTAIEIHLITRNADGSAMDEIVETVQWPEEG